MTACALCEELIADDANAHLYHDGDCTRFVAGFCRCDGWICSACCPDSSCVTPLAARLQIANEQHRASIPLEEAS